jgi:hypothetical protein
VARWFVNPFVKETGMMGFWNPRRRRRHHPRSHHRRRHRARHRRNPILLQNPRRGRGGRGAFGVMTLLSRPQMLLVDGTAGTVSAFMTLAVPNWLLPFPGSDMMSRVLRFASRAVAGGLIYDLGRRMMPRQAPAILSGAMVAVGGGLVLDLLNTRLEIGQGDTTVTPATLIGGFAGYGAYTRPMGAYTRPLIPSGFGYTNWTPRTPMRTPAEIGALSPGQQAALRALPPAAQSAYADYWTNYYGRFGLTGMRGMGGVYGAASPGLVNNNLYT